MNMLSIGSTLSPYRAAIRAPRFENIEHGYGNQSHQRVATEVDSLSLQTRMDLSQKAQVLPPPPPAETKRKPTLPPKKEQAKVSTQDFTGRTCSGTLHGPLLMEEPQMEVEARPSAFRSVDFVFDNQQDFAPLRGASLALAALEPSVLHAPGADQPLAVIPSSDSQFAYFGVRNGQAVIVQQFQEAQPQAQSSQVRLPNGQVATILRSADDQMQLSIHLPAASLDDLAQWGRSLLAVA
ncbi:hypothetical protein JST97_30020 [bacterium]|nr:hypothetical protein [bacterium]